MRLARFTEGGKASPFSLGKLPEHSPSAPLPFLTKVDTSVHLYKEFLDDGFSQAHDELSTAANRDRCAVPLSSQSSSDRYGKHGAQVAACTLVVVHVNQKPDTA
jgi:hypothetical protein